MKRAGLGVILWALAIILILAMLLTLYYGRRGDSRHGYGQTTLVLLGSDCA